jgi:DNA-directed RNA polymerase I subunit RPA2
MEDAMILNKSSVERGLAHASMYKNEAVDLREERNSRMSLAPEPHDTRSKVCACVCIVVVGLGVGMYA